MEVAGLIAVGLAAGTLSGLLGIGGATILLPALVLIYGLTQHMAQGTSLAALLLPVGLLAVIKYNQVGNVNWKFALFMALGFVIGGFIGAHFAQPLPDAFLKKLFGAYLLVIGLQMIFFS